MMILGIDVGLVNTGWAIMSYYDGWHVHETGIIKTEGSAKKVKIYKCDDLTRRVREILDGLASVVGTYQPKAIVAEMPSGGSKSAAGARGMAIGLTATVALAWGTKLPLISIIPTQSKKACCGSANASKNAMQAFVAQQHPEVAEQYAKSSNNSGYEGCFEHIADAICAVHSAEHDSTVMLLMQGAAYVSLGGTSVMQLPAGYGPVTTGGDAPWE